MRSIILLSVLMTLVLPSMALSPIEKAYMNGVKDGLNLGQLIDNEAQYNIAVQQFNDKLNETYGINASEMWLPLIATNDASQEISYTSSKPIHKLDATPLETTVIQY